MTRNLFLYNPNTTAAMTHRMEPAARAVLPQGFDLVASQAAYGPESIEGYYDEALCVPPLLERFEQLTPDDYQAAIIGCFDDTGLDAARCVTDIPVVGLCQSACITATHIASSFAVVTTLEKSVPALEHIIARYGYGAACKTVLASDIAVLDLESPNSGAASKLAALAQQAVAQHRVEAIILGCAGMVELSAELERAVGVPVIEPVSAATTQAVALALGQRMTSRARAYQKPTAKKRTRFP